MGIANRFVQAVLDSPAHRLLSGSTDVVRYRGRRSDREYTTPTQYARRGDDLIILVGRPDTKRWWRNFREDRDIDVLVRGQWLPMTGRAMVGSEEPEIVAPLLETYLERFPKATRLLPGDAIAEMAEAAVVVWCRPRG